MALPRRPGSAALAVLGAVVSTLIALWFGTSGNAVAAGLYGFSAVLTAVALGCVFYRRSWRVVPCVLLAVVFTVIVFTVVVFTVVVQGALNTALAPVGIPALTAPFVFATWFFLLPKRDLAQTSHRELPEHDIVEIR